MLAILYLFLCVAGILVFDHILLSQVFEPLIIYTLASSLPPHRYGLSPGMSCDCVSNCYANSHKDRM